MKIRNIMALIVTLSLFLGAPAFAKETVRYGFDEPRFTALYDDIVNYAILDPSAGRGQEINVAFTRRCYEAINRLMPNLGLVAAGGLHADNVEDKLSGLLREFPLSTDAEGKLRTPDDHLDVAKAIRYMHATDALLRKFEAQRQPQLVN